MSEFIPTSTERHVYQAIAESLIDFGYPQCTAEMIQDAHETKLNGGTHEDAKYGVISAFAFSELDKVIELGIPIRKGAQPKEDSSE